LKSWEQSIRLTSGAAASAQKWQVPGRDIPIGVSVSVALPRPKSLPRKQASHVKKPDLDKLIRAVLDALTGIGYEDDSQVVMIDAIKEYVRDGAMPGILVCVQTEP
jgi:crossover junction endodeoxyribonuclease RusA